MAFFKKVKQKINEKWYPQSVTVGKPVTTNEVARRIAAEFTVSPADTYPVLKSLGGVLGDFMVNGRTIKLEGLGTFYYTAANGNGADITEKVTAAQITDVRVRFIPEKHTNSSHQVTPAPSSPTISSEKSAQVKHPPLVVMNQKPKD